ncbi:MAG TPA: cell division protein FtsQ/DivIB [Acetobacteraceae bacterium]|nr:cell division protein FtsQ/DivIB [Acetobacteraceae bacterium]
MPRVTRTPRNSVNDRPAWLKLLLRRQRRLLRPAAWVAGAFLVAMLLIGLLRSAVPTAGNSLESMRERIGTLTAFAGLRIEHIEFEGRQNTPEPLLNAALGVTKGEPILGFSLDAARKRIETLSWVKQATVERRLPSTIVVNIKERRPFAIWQNDNKFMLIDRDGNVVASHQDLAHFRNLPLVVGPGAPQAAAPLIDALMARPALQKYVVAAVRVGERRWNLLMTSGANVMLPEGHEVAALDRLMQLQQGHDLLDRPLVAIDMRLPDRLVLRPKPGDTVPIPQPPKKPT